MNDGPESTFGELERQRARDLIALAFDEDLGPDGDLTSLATIPAHARGSAPSSPGAAGVAAGLPVVGLIAGSFDLTWAPACPDGDPLMPGSELGTLRGSMRDLLAAERTALNFLQRLSGIATLTRRFADAVAGTKAVILDTRKTTPGWRVLEKYAVRCGGGQNHRAGLYDAVLIKDNHLAWLAAEPDPIGRAIRAARGNTLRRGRSLRSRSIRSTSSTAPGDPARHHPGR